MTQFAVLSSLKQLANYLMLKQESPNDDDPTESDQYHVASRSRDA